MAKKRISIDELQVGMFMEADVRESVSGAAAKNVLLLGKGMLITSATTASTSMAAPIWISPFCSMIDGLPRRRTVRSDPSGSRYTASEPVVFANTRRPSVRNTDASIRVTLDFPRVPVTEILRGMAL